MYVKFFCHPTLLLQYCIAPKPLRIKTFSFWHTICQFCTYATHKRRTNNSKERQQTVAKSLQCLFILNGVFTAVRGQPRLE